MVHDGRGLKLQKVGPIFSSLNAMHAKFSKKKIIFGASSMILKSSSYHVAIATLIFSHGYNMLFSHVKMSCFRSKFHCCLYNNFFPKVLSTLLARNCAFDFGV